MISYRFLSTKIEGWTTPLGSLKLGNLGCRLVGIVTYLIDERQLIFFNRLQYTDNPIMRTLSHLPTVKYEILGLAAKYGLNGVQVACLL